MKGYISKGKSKTGTYNYQNGNSNQDSMSIFESKDNKKIVGICVNDGCSACDYPIDACKINNEVFKKIASSKNLWQMPEKNALKYIYNEYKEAFANADLPADKLCNKNNINLIFSKPRYYRTIILNIDNFKDMSIIIKLTSLSQP